MKWLASYSIPKEKNLHNPPFQMFIFRTRLDRMYFVKREANYTAWLTQGELQVPQINRNRGLIRPKISKGSAVQYSNCMVTKPMHVSAQSGSVVIGRMQYYILHLQVHVCHNNAFSPQPASSSDYSLSVVTNIKLSTLKPIQHIPSSSSSTSIQ
jgi:hypothetical protein